MVLAFPLLITERVTFFAMHKQLVRKVAISVRNEEPPDTEVYFDGSFPNYIIN
jgi:hypothetical protein